MKNPAKIIVIEDDTDINKLLAYNLRKEGFLVEQAFDGAKASEKLLTETFDIVILDIMLPGIDGFNICRQIKDDHRFLRSFVVILSAKTDHQDKLYARILGADCYFTKPFNICTLMRVINEFTAMQNNELQVSLK